MADTGTTMRMDGNNVDVEYEMNELAKNNIEYRRAAAKNEQRVYPSQDGDRREGR